MILSGKRICEEIERGTLTIDPFEPKQMGPNSYNLRLHADLACYENELLDMKAPQPLRRFSIPPEGMILDPGVLYLGRTVEYTETRNFVPMLEGRSSIGRLGLSVHITAGFGDVGFRGFWTLEIFALKPIRVYAGVEICQVFYHEIAGQFDEYKSKKYQDNRDLQPSLLHQDFE
ncbi:MAG: dCTP deaminase [Deltaproteobacteria bacterium]|nr:dCTP deaminase [Deltaproteobacteria bacterium]